MKTKFRFAISTLTLVVAFLIQVNFSHSQTPVEVGKVNWNRDLEKAKTISANTGKPLFVQFQEVPG